MRKGGVFPILFFGGLWGISEALRGNAPYASHVRYASVGLTVIGFFLLALSRAFVPQFGAATVIAPSAMLYKFLNTPFFACHWTGIALLGCAWDTVFGLEPVRSRALAVVLAVCFGSLLFTAAMVFVVRSEHWVPPGLSGWWEHVGRAGTLTAAGCALPVPAGLRLEARRRQRVSAPDLAGWLPVTRSAFVLTACLWSYGMAVRVLRD